MGYWEGYPTQFQWDIRGLIHWEGSWAELDVLMDPLSWTRPGARCSQSSDLPRPLPTPLPSDLPRGSRWNPRLSCAAPPPAASRDPSPPPASLHLPGEHTGVRAQPHPVPAPLLGTPLSPTSGKGGDDIVSAPRGQGHGKGGDTRGPWLRFPSFHLH